MVPGSISLSALKLFLNDLWSCYELFLIVLANRFNSAYYLLLITGMWSGGETSTRLKFVGCG